jgi:hypothetical protein
VLRSFFQGPIHVTEVRLDGFTVSILRDAGGRWRAPAVFPAPSRGAGGGIGIDRVRVFGGRLLIFDVGANGALRERSRIDDMRTDLLVGPEGLRLAPLTGRVADAAISGQAETDAQSVRLDFSAAAIRDADLPALFGLLAASRPAVLRVDEPAAALEPRALPSPRVGLDARIRGHARPVDASIARPSRAYEAHACR